MAKSRTLTVTIAADAAGFSRGLTTASRDADKFEKKLGGVGQKVGRAMAGLGAVAGGAVVVGLKKSVEAAVEAEKAQAKLAAQLETIGKNTPKVTREIDKVIQAQSQLSGFDDEDLGSSFTNLVRVTGDVDEALKLNGLAMDLARAKNIDVAKAGELVGKVAGGNVGALKRYGVSVKEGATAQEALAAAQSSFAGQAKAYGETTAGAQERASVAFENAAEALGAKLAPAFAAIANRAANFVGQMQEGSGAGGRFAAVMSALGARVRAVAGFFRQHTTAAKVLGGVIVGVIATLAIHRTGVIAVSAAQRVARVATLAWAGAQRVLNLAMRANPIGLVITALVALGTGLVMAYRRSETFRRVVDRAFAAVKGVVSGAVPAIRAAIGRIADAFGSIIASAKRLPGRLAGAFSDTTAKIGEWVSNFKTAALRLGSSIVSGIVGGLGQLGHKILKKITDAWGWVKGKVPKFSLPGIGIGDVTGATPGVMPGGGGGGGGKMPGGVTGDTDFSPAARGVAGRIAGLFGGFRVSSGRRSPAENAAAGGAPNSDHLAGNAIDLVPSAGWSPAGVAQMDRIVAWARKQPFIRWIGWRGVKNHGPGNHLHLSVGGRAAGDVGAGTPGALMGLGGRIKGVGDVAPRLSGQQQIIRDAAKRHGINPAILWGLYGAETNFGRNKNNSSAGAQGPFQFMPATARAYGIDPHNFGQAANAAAKYLATYEGRGVAGMLSAYNAGPAGNPNNPETRAYIPKVQALAKTWPGDAAGAGEESDGPDGTSRARKRGGRITPRITPANQKYLDMVNSRLGRLQAEVKRTSANASLDSAAAYEYEGATLERDLGRAGTTKTSVDDRAVRERQRKYYATRQRAIKERMAKVKRALRTSKAMRPGTRKRLLDERQSLLQEATQLGASQSEVGTALYEIDNPAQDEVEVDPGPTQSDRIEAWAAEASLTAGDEDDKAAAQARADLLAFDLQGARESGDARRIAEAASNYKSARDALEQLNESAKVAAEAAEAQARAQEEHTNALKSVAEEMKRQNDIAGQVMSITSREAVRALADTLSGHIAGPMGFGGRSMTAGDGVTRATYGTARA